MSRVWSWLAENKDQVGVLLTAGGVLLAVIYAWLTRSLARTTQRMYESSYRPYLQVQLGHGNVFKPPDYYSFRFQLAAYGQVPAIVTGWELEVTPAPPAVGGIYPIPKPLLSLLEEGDSCVYPGAPEPTTLVIRSQGAGAVSSGDQLPTVLVVLTVKYRGPHWTPYRTTIIVEGNFNAGWKVNRYEVR